MAKYRDSKAKNSSAVQPAASHDTQQYLNISNQGMLETNHHKHHKHHKKHPSSSLNGPDTEDLNGYSPATQPRTEHTTNHKKHK
jgi:hypothetical protein